MNGHRSNRPSTMQKFDITTLINHFEVHNRTEGKSLRTVAWYNEALQLFLDWLTKNGLSTGLDQIRLSVSDDGVGLPVDYEERGHGFANMRACAERLDRLLIVEHTGPDGGATVTCLMPLGRRGQEV